MLSYNTIILVIFVALLLVIVIYYRYRLIEKKLYYNRFVLRVDHFSENMLDLPNQVSIRNPVDGGSMQWFDNDFTRKNFPGPHFQARQKHNSLEYVLKKGKGVLDIGAHIGDYGICLAIALKRMKITNIPVYCIDPSIEKCEFMRTACRINGLTDRNIKVICSGISDKEGSYSVKKIGILKGGSNTGSWQWHSDTKGTQFTTLDKLWKNGVIGEIGFFWFDAQWMEPLVLRGGVKFLSHSKPYVLMEYERITEYEEDKLTVKSFEKGYFDHLKKDIDFKEIFKLLNIRFVKHGPEFDDILLEIV